MFPPKTLYAFFLLFCFLGMFSHLVSYSDGPPPGRTAAPGELSCYNGYCHNSFPLNSGPALAELRTDIPAGGYVPGSTYTIRPFISSPGMKRFGFQLQVVEEATGLGAGQFIGFDTTQLQLLQEMGRTYITHSLAQARDDSAAWEFEWQAPASGRGSITVYAAFVAANFNGNRAGDYVYTRNLGIAEDPQTALQTQNPLPLSIYPLPVGEVLFVEFPAGLNPAIEVKDLRGQSMYRRVPSRQEVSSCRIDTRLWPAGLYVIRLTARGKSWSRKVLKL
ncbi:MAG: T9SS C-terminal target domain-containing protein [Bacteroidetes bacterium]|nr:MAG: T9SS C-terminal target domain-containing protein [Bacteroidota bacterium]